MKKKTISGLCVLFLMGGIVFGADWPNYRGPEHNGISTETGWDAADLEDPDIVWEASIGTGFSSIAVADGKAYSMGNIDDKDYVYCFDADSGKELWKHSYEHPLDRKYYEGGPSATPSFDDGKVYTISKRGHIFCLDADSGNVVWKNKLDIERPTWGLAGSPLVHDELIVYNAGKYGVAVKKATGEVVWQNGKGPSGYSTPVPYMAGDKKAAILFGQDRVFAVEVETGEKLWQEKWKTKHDVNAADPIIKGNKVFITSGYGSGCALIRIDGNKATRIWGEEKETTNMRSQMSGPVLWEGYLYGINQNELVCLDFETGKTMWSFKPVGNGSLIIVDGKIVTLSDKGTLYIAEASPEGFNEISSAKILRGRCWAPPAFSGGKVYARTSRGDLVCVDLSNE